MACEYNNILNNIENMLSKLSDNQKERDDVKPLIKWLNEAKVIGKPNENFDKDLDTKLRDTLTKLYPEIKLEYTEDEIQYIDSNGNVMNQEEASNLVKYTLKVVDTLYDIGTPKKSKHGGNNQPVRSTIKLNSKENPNIEVNLTKYLAGKGVSKEQIEYMFEYMRQNNIQEIGTLNLAERLLFGLTHNVEIKTAMKPELIYMEEENYYEPSGESSNTPSKVYQKLSVPGGTNYKEMEIVTPNVKAKLKGHAEFATDEGIGWYRVDTEVIGQKVESPNLLNNTWDNNTGTPTKTLRVLEMQSDMFQKQKDVNLAVDSYITSIEKAYTTITGDEEVTSKKAYEYFENKGANIIVKEDGLYIDIGNPDIDINKAFHQILNTDNKWVRFFIKSIVQNAQRNGYEKIRFPSGETAAKVEGHDTLVDIIRKKEKTLNNVEKAIIKNTEQLAQAKKDSNKYKIDLHTDKLVTLNEEKATLTKELKENNIAKLAPIEGFYQVRVQNTLKKEYGTDKVKTVTDEHGNKWFELELDSKRDSQAIMLQQQGGKIKGQANIEAGTVLINSLLQSQDTLPHEYAHHYIAWFRDTPIVQEAIKKWGNLPEKSGKINVYYGDPESATSTKLLSNLAKRPFKYDGVEYGSVEHAYQTLKSGTFDKNTYDAYTKIGGYGRKIRGKSANKDFDNLALMEDLVVESFIQNSDSIASEKLLTYSTFTHNTDTLIDRAFLKGLYKAQEKLIDIKKLQGEEALVQAIGEQVVKQKGEVYGWWKKFTKWLQDIFDSQSSKSKESIKNLLTDSFLTRQNLKEDSKYTVYPKAKPDMVKAKYKAGKATKYVGYGKAGSSTELYAKQLSEQGMPVNIGKYNEKDVVFVSVNGTPNREDYVNTLKQVIAALESGATVLTDSESYLSKSNYNKGEIQLAKNLINRGYIRETSKDNSLVGVWVKPKKEAVKEKTKQQENVQDSTKGTSEEVKLKQLLEAYSTGSAPKIGGGLVEDVTWWETRDEDKPKATMMKGTQEESLKDMLPKIDGRKLIKYKKAVDNWYNKHKRGIDIRETLNELLDILNTVEQEPRLAEEFGWDTVATKQEDSIIYANEIIKAAQECAKG